MKYSNDEYMKMVALLDKKMKAYRSNYPHAARLFNFFPPHPDFLLNLFEKAQNREIILKNGTEDGEIVDWIIYYGFYDHETDEMEWINPPPDNER